MKVLFIGDIHGKTDWRWVLTHLMYFEKIIFIGDYVDSFTVTSRVIEDNLRAIIALKIKYPDKIVLLLGNHDYAYVFNKSSTSGFRPEEYFDLHEIFETNWNLFDIAWGYESKKYFNADGTPKYTLATHAGLTQTFKSYYINNQFETEGTLLNKMYASHSAFFNAPLHEILNYLKDNITMMWIIGRARYGVNRTGSVMWADKAELKKERYGGIDQVVGHTGSYYIEIDKSEYGDIYFIDKKCDETTFSLALDL